ISDPAFNPTRGFRLKSREASKPLAVQRFDLLGDVLLPPAARRRIAEAGARLLVVVPDGPLHKLPLEALLLRDGDRTYFAVEKLPAITYAPSAAVLPLLSRRCATAVTAVARGPLSLLTVSNPAYPQRKEDQADTTRAVAPEALGLAGPLPLLPN